MTKPVVKDIRQKIASELAQQFIASGTTYTCTAVVINFCRTHALKNAQELICAGINFSKSLHTDPAHKMADMLSLQAAKTVHSHFYPV